MIIQIMSIYVFSSQSSTGYEDELCGNNPPIELSPDNIVKWKSERIHSIQDVSTENANSITSPNNTNVVSGNDNSTENVCNGNSSNNNIFFLKS